jgi:cell division protein FtsW
VSREGREVTVAEQVLVLVTLGLVGFGIVMVYSASSGLAMDSYGDSLYFLKRDVAYALVGIVGFLLCARLDYRRLGRISPLLLGVSLVLLLAVAAVGVTVNGAKRWLPIGPFTLQPSELAKLALCLYAAWMLAEQGRAPRDWRELMRPVGTVTLGVCALLMVEKDLGSAIGVAIVAGAILLVSGTRAGVMVRVTGAALVATAAMIWTESYRRDRFLIFLDPWSDPQNRGYQLVHSELAFATGGIFGLGLGQGIEKINSLPEAHTDMIFAIVGEELGLLGVVGVIAAFVALGWAGFTIAMRAKDPFGKRLAAGVTALIVGQAAINMGGVLSVLPLTGVPIPLISYGGTSLIATLMGMGLVLSVAAHDRARPLRVAPPAPPRRRATERPDGAPEQPAETPRKRASSRRRR